MEKVPEAYSFSPRFTADTTVSVTIANGSPYQTVGMMTVGTPKNQALLEGTIYYRNIGYYQGKVKDVNVKFVTKNTSKLIIKDIGFYNIFNPKVAGIAEAKITTIFINQKTGLPKVVSGNFTIDNINQAKYLGLTLSEYSHICAMADSV